MDIRLNLAAVEKAKSPDPLCRGQKSQEDELKS